MTDLALSQLNLFPVKSMRGMSVPRWQVGPRGLLHDRELMVVDPGGRFITQREEAKMALVAAEIAGDHLLLRAPGASPLDLPLAARSSERARVSIWNDEVRAEPVGAEADGWMSRVLARSVRLVRFPADELRQVDLRFARAGDEVGFADGFSRAPAARSPRSIPTPARPASSRSARSPPTAGAPARCFSDGTLCTAAPGRSRSGIRSRSCPDPRRLGRQRAKNAARRRRERNHRRRRMTYRRSP